MISSEHLYQQIKEKIGLPDKAYKVAIEVECGKPVEVKVWYYLDEDLTPEFAQYRLVEK